MHIVIRRFSDFEYLLNKLVSKEEYQSICFPPLPEKRMYGNLEDAFIEKRRLELEGFLRVMVKINKSIKSDPHVYAFLTQNEEQYKEYKDNPSFLVEKFNAVYNYIPAMPS